MPIVHSHNTEARRRILPIEQTLARGFQKGADGLAFPSQPLTAFQPSLTNRLGLHSLHLESPGTTHGAALPQSIGSGSARTARGSSAPPPSRALPSQLEINRDPRVTANLKRTEGHPALPNPGLDRLSNLQFDDLHAELDALGFAGLSEYGSNFDPASFAPLGLDGGLAAPSLPPRPFPKPPAKDVFTCPVCLVDGPLHTIMLCGNHKVCAECAPRLLGDCGDRPGDTPTWPIYLPSSNPEPRRPRLEIDPDSSDDESSYGILPASPGNGPSGLPASPPTDWSTYAQYGPKCPVCRATLDVLAIRTRIAKYESHCKRSEDERLRRQQRPVKRLMDNVIRQVRQAATLRSIALEAQADKFGEDFDERIDVPPQKAPPTRPGAKTPLIASGKSAPSLKRLKKQAMKQCASRRAPPQSASYRAPSSALDDPVPAGPLRAPGGTLPLFTKRPVSQTAPVRHDPKTGNQIPPPPPLPPPQPRAPRDPTPRPIEQRMSGLPPTQCDYRAGGFGIAYGHTVSRALQAQAETAKRPASFMPGAPRSNSLNKQTNKSARLSYSKSAFPRNSRKFTDTKNYGSKNRVNKNKGQKAAGAFNGCNRDTRPPKYRGRRIPRAANRPEASPPDDAPSVVTTTAIMNATLGRHHTSEIVVIIILCLWHVSHKLWNRLMHALHGNTTMEPIIRKLNTSGMPILETGATTPEKYLEFKIELQGWAASHGISQWITGPLPAAPVQPVPPTQASADALARHNDQVSQGMRYVCAAIKDSNLRSAMAVGAGMANQNGPRCLLWLSEEILQGIDEQPALQTILDNMALQPKESLIAFKARFTKINNALLPQPAQQTTCAKFVTAVTKETGTFYDDCVTAALSAAPPNNFNAFANTLARLCTNKAMRSEKAADQAASALTTEMQALRTEIRAELQAMRAEGANPRKTPLRTGNDERKKRECTNCGKVGHIARECPEEKTKCTFRFGDGTRCNGPHLEKFCFFKHPELVRDPKMRTAVDRKLAAKTGNKASGMHSAHADDVDSDGSIDMFQVDIVEYDFGDDNSGPTREQWIEASNYEHRQRNNNDNGGGDNNNIVEYGSSVPGEVHGFVLSLEHTAGLPTALQPPTDYVKDHPPYMCIDTGAQDHIISDPRCITHPDEHRPVDTVIRMADGSCVTAQSRGPATFQVACNDGSPVLVTRMVLYCPDLPINLFSPAKEWSENKGKITFMDICTLQIREGVIPFRLEGGQYKLSYHPAPTARSHITFGISYNGRSGSWCHRSQCEHHCNCNFTAVSQPPDALSNLPDDLLIHVIAPLLDDPSVSTLHSTCRQLKEGLAHEVAERCADAHTAALKRGWTNLVHERTFLRTVAAQQRVLNVDRAGAYHFVPIRGTPLAAHPVELIEANVSTKQSVNTAYLYIDTGASDHIISDERCITEPGKHQPVSIAIRTGNGVSYAKSRGPATFTVKDTNGRSLVITRDVIFCPGFRVNLFSPAKEWKDRQGKVTFEDTCELQLSEGTLPFRAEGNSYKLDYAPGGTPPLSASANTGAVTELEHHRALDEISLWHRRTGHTSFTALTKLPMHAVGPNFTLSKSEAADKYQDACTICNHARMKNDPHPKHSIKVANGQHKAKINPHKKYGDCVFMDLAGPLPVAAFHTRARYISIFVDAATMHLGLYLIREKSDQIVAHKRYCADMSAHGALEAKHFHSDNGGEYTSAEYCKLIMENGALKTTIVAKSPAMNGVAEAAFYRIFSMIRALLIDSGLPKEHWGATALFSAYILNRVPRTHGGDTVYELLNDRPADLRHVRIFGCLASALLPRNDRTSKIHDVADTGFYVGPARYQRGHLIWIPGKDKYIVARTVRFNEKVTYFDHLKLRPSPTPGEEPAADDEGDDDDADEIAVRRMTVNPPAPPPAVNQPAPHNNAPAGAGRTLRPRDPQVLQRMARLGAVADTGPVDALSATMLQDERAFEALIHDDLGNVTHISEPSNFFEAMRSPQSELWKAAIREELQSHKVNNTWETVASSSLPPGTALVGSTWVFKIKRNADGSVARYKARLCAQGFSQIAGLHYDHTYSSALTRSTFRCLLAIAARLGLRLTGADVKTAYLYSFIDDGLLVAMRLPPGFQETAPDGSPMVGKLVKSIYGLKQSAARWEARLCKFLLESGFTRCDVDPCLYLLRRGEVYLFLAVYVDDLIIASSCDDLRANVLATLRKEFEITDTGPLTWVLGSSVTQDLDAGTVSLCQKLYIDDMAKVLLPDDADATKGTRVNPAADELTHLVPGDPDKFDPLYRKGVGMLAWLVAISRPDIAYVQSILARFSACGGETHLKCLQHAVRYLVRTKGYAITYRKHDSGALSAMLVEHSKFRPEVLEGDELVSFTDSSHGGEKPMMGEVHFLADGPVDWRAGRHTSTAISATEGEYIAASRAAMTTMALDRVVAFLFQVHGPRRPTVLFCDNLAAVMLSDSNITSKRVKHVMTRLAYLRERVAEDSIYLYHVGTKGQVADIMTKTLPTGTFHDLRCFLLN